MEVWIVESGDYEQRGVDLVADSLDAAVAAIKAPYGPPYIVRWDELKDTSYGHTLTGRFKEVVGYSIEHTASYDILLMPLHTLTPTV